MSREILILFDTVLDFLGLISFYNQLYAILLVLSCDGR